MSAGADGAQAHNKAPSDYDITQADVMRYEVIKDRPESEWSDSDKRIYYLVIGNPLKAARAKYVAFAKEILKLEWVEEPPGDMDKFCVETLAKLKGEVAAMAEDARSTRFTLYTAADAMQPQPPIEWRIHELISAGSVNVIYGAPGTGKTWIALSMAVCCAIGKRWLDFDTTPCNVLLVDEESGERRMKRRLGAALRGELIGKDAVKDVPVTCVSLSRLNLRTIEDANELQALIMQTGAGVVVIDALADIMPGADENSVKDTQPVFQNLRAVANTTGAAIILIHHANKMGGYRGSSAINGAVDLMLQVEKKAGSPNIDFESVKARDTESLKFAAQIHFTEDQTYLIAADAPTRQAYTSKAESYVIRYLEEHAGTATIDDITNNADTCSGESARRAIYSLTSKKLIARTDGGSGAGRGRQAVYSLSKKEEEHD